MAQDALDSVVSHWSTLIENFQVPPLSFYQCVDVAVARRQVPETRSSRADHREAGLLSANREYVHYQRETLTFNLCASPFGTGFFVSWWLTDEVPKMNPLLRVLSIVVMFGVALWLLGTFGLVAGIITVVGLVLGGMAGANAMAASGSLNDKSIRALPFLGPLYVWLFKPATFYRIDSAEMFQAAVHNAVLEVIDALTTEKGVRALAESDRKPIMREFYARKGA